MNCKFYSEEICKCLFDGPPDNCTFINKEECTCFRPMEYEKESSPYRLNNTEVNVFSKLFKDYIKDENKLEKLVETFGAYLSNASKSPANAEGKCDNEDTLYRIIKERVEDNEEPEVVERFKENKLTFQSDKVETVKLMPDNGRSIDKRTLTIQNCDKIILKPKSLEVEVKIEKDNFEDFDYIVINGIKFKREK